MAESKAQRTLLTKFSIHTLVAYTLLALIILMGGAFRFMGLNWDDFAHLHPDERFLTLSVLPGLGGNLEFTPDAEHFPNQALLASPTASALNTRAEIINDNTLRIGAEAGTLAADVVRWWLGDARVQVYENVNVLQQAANNGEISVVVVAENNISPALGSFRRIDVLNSQTVQRIRCEGLNPTTRGIGGYFDTQCSPLNPHNAGTGFYTYGTLPLFMAHVTSNFVQVQDLNGSPLFDFQGGTLVWRFLSAFFDVGTIILLFFIGARLHTRYVGLMAAALYAAAPLAIQLSHFGTVNAISAFFVTLALWAAVGVQDRGRWTDYLIFGVAFGAAVAGRVNLAPLAGVVIVASVVQALPAFDDRLAGPERRRLLLSNFIGLVIAGVTSILVFRIANPYAFMGPSFFGILPNPRWFADIAQGSFGVSGQLEIPPNWQWLARPAYLYPLKDMLLWGMGIALGVMGWFGFGWGLYKLLRGRAWALRNVILLAWVGAYFAFMGRIWVMTMRYYIPLYGALALLAAWALYELWRLARQRGHDIFLTRCLLLGFAGLMAAIPAYYAINGYAQTATSLTAGVIAIVLFVLTALPFLRGQRAYVLGAFVLAFSVLWATMFTALYREQVTRSQAARWMWEQIPGDFAMQIEGAPEGTPLINIAFANNRAESSTSPESLAATPTYLTENAPLFDEFTALADGVIFEVQAPHLGDPLADNDVESVLLSISQLGAGTNDALATATLTRDFADAEHVLGDRHTLMLDRPLEVSAGETYQVKVEALAGPLTVGGSVVVTEGQWDDRLTSIKICRLPHNMTLADNVPPGYVGFDDCQGYEGWFALVHSYDLYMHYAPDTAFKRDHTIEALHVGDYYAITSNRFYDGVFRNRLRWPFSSEFYDLLFAGDLGYDLVATFDHSFELGPLRVADQHLPSYDSPRWFDAFEADEAFHVYDHPAVFIFQKRDDYDPERTAFLLNSISVNTQSDILGPGGDPGARAIGVVERTTLQADAAPTGLKLPPEIYDLQRMYGTWSERFDSSSILYTNQVVGLLVFWLVIIVFGWLAWPILFAMFPAFADRGYGFAKLVGLLLVSYLAWFVASLSIPVWSQAGVFAAMLLIGAFSTWLAWKRKEAMRDYLREHWRRIAWIELITFVLFLILVGVRLTNPDLWHDSKGGEKPMDFAYFNAVLRSSVFPPYDPWHAEGFINYYYYGFVLVGSPVLLLKLVPAFAYNLLVPLIFALTGIGAFSGAFNIVAWRRERRQQHVQADSNRARRMNAAWLAGIAALLLCVVFGNLDTIRVLGNGVARLGGYQTPTGLENYLVQEYTEQNDGSAPDPEALVQLQARAAAGYLTDNIAYEFNNSVELVSGFLAGLGRALSGQPLPIGIDRWYWGPTRVLTETPGVGGGAITEMPYFTFLYGDLHAHMIAMPVMLFAILFIFNEVVMAERERRTQFVRFIALALGAMAIGMMRPINTWDWPTFMLFGVIGLGYAWWLRWREFSRWSLLYLLLHVGGFIVLALGFALPYTTWYAATYNSVLPWTGGKTPLWAYFDIHGLFLFLIVSLFVWETGRWLRSVKVKALRGRGNTIVLLLLGVFFLLLVLVGIAMLEYQVVLIAVPLILWIVPLFFRPNQGRDMQFVLVLIGLALALTVAVEFVVLAGDNGRQNTVFKFYIQVWLLFSVAGGVIFGWLFERIEDWSPRLRWSWLVPLVILVSIAALFPLMATRGKAFTRYTQEVPLTLDGLEYMQYAQHRMFDYSAVIPFEDDYYMIRWLQENVAGTPVIMEGRSAASEYRYNARISINTGLPAVLGWNWHQRQQRTLAPLPSLVQQREANVKYFYNSGHIQNAARLLREYDVRYVILGEMELAVIEGENAEEGLAKFWPMEQIGILTPVFERNRSVIYEVYPERLEEFLFVNDTLERAENWGTTLAMLRENPAEWIFVGDSNADLEAIGSVYTEQQQAYRQRMRTLRNTNVLQVFGVVEDHVVYTINETALRGFEATNRMDE